MHVLLVQLIVASIQEDWEEKFDENLKPYYKHVKTGESSREDANERCATILCGCASRSDWRATSAQAPPEPVRQLVVGTLRYSSEIPGLPALLRWNSRLDPGM
jgi:hypothetical protein